MANTNSPRTAAKPQSVAISNPPAPSLRTLEAPIIAPEFVDTLHQHALQMVYDYLSECGPVEVFELYRAAEGLRIFGEDLKRHAGQVTADMNSDILKTVTEAVNAIAAMGGQFTDGSTCSIRRTPQLTPVRKARKGTWKAKGGACPISSRSKSFLLCVATDGPSAS